MKHNLSTISLAVLSLFAVSGANAADIFGGGSKDGPGGGDGPALVNWSGLYIGGAVGFGNANHDLSVNDFYKDFCTANDPAAANYDGKADNAGSSTDTLSNINNGSFTLGVKPLKPFTKCEEIARNGSNLLTGVPVTSPTPGAFTSPGHSEKVAGLDGMNTDGLVGDVRLGYDIARGRFLFGVFGSYGFNDMSGEGSAISGGKVSSFTLEKGSEWSVGARAGLIVAPRTLAYILAAYTQTEYDISGIDASKPAGKQSFSGGADFDGITVGGGVEFALTSNIFFGIEGTHTFYGGETLLSEYDAAKNLGTRLDDDLSETRVMGTLKVKLNSGLPGISD